MKVLQKNVVSPEVVSDAMPDPISSKPNLKDDKLNFSLLILLYTMQGIPLGFTSMALPIIMQSKNTVSFEDQALFSLVLWPNSIRLIWAPLVDAIYLPWIGRRKTWLVPIQYLMGTSILYSAYNIEDWLPSTGKPNVLALTIVFIILNFLTALQNIVVDGWALTMLKKANVGYSSASSSSGFAIGSMLGSIVPVLLTSEDFNNHNIQSTPSTGGIITLEKFLLIWGVILILITTLIGIFKKEKDTKSEDNYVKLNIIQNYKLLWDITKLPSIRVLIVTFLTLKFGLATLRTSLVNLKLVAIGVPKDDIMILSTVMYAVKILIPIAVSKYTSGPKPISVCLNVIPVRLFWALTYIYFIYYTPMLIYHNGVLDVPIYYYIMLGILNAINDALLFIMLAATGSFFSRISDPRFGGTYMTLLNSISNFGFVWASTLGLKCMDFLTFKSCSNDAHNNCSTGDLKNTCNTNGGECVTILDGYYVEIIISIVFVLIWYCIFKKILKSYETTSPSHWLVYFNNRPNEEIAKDCKNSICSTSK